MRKIVIILLSVAAYCACSKDETGVFIKPEVTFSKFLDERDSNVYNCITVDGQTWMAENLRYRLPLGSFEGCYTFLEEKYDTSKYVFDNEQFKEKVKEAVANGSIVDPPGLPLPRRPTFIIKMNINYIGMSMTALRFKSMFTQWPEVYAIVDGIYQGIAEQAKYDTALAHMLETEAKNEKYADEYGFLYSYDAALKALPEGWRLPTDEDWKHLEKALGMPMQEIERMEEWRGNREGCLLKKGEEGIGYDALLGGGKVYGIFENGASYQYRGVNTYFWSSTCVSQNDSVSLAVTRSLSYTNDRIYRGTSRLDGTAYCVRGIKK